MAAVQRVFSVQLLLWRVNMVHSMEHIPQIRRVAAGAWKLSEDTDVSLPGLSWASHSANAVAQQH
eukprot:6481029-Amphidinium_carterae.1